MRTSTRPTLLGPVLTLVAMALFVALVIVRESLPPSTPYEVYRVVDIGGPALVTVILVLGTWLTPTLEGRQLLAGWQMRVGGLCVALSTWVTFGPDQNIGGGLAVFLTLGMLFLVATLSFGLSVRSLLRERRGSSA